MLALVLHPSDTRRPKHQIRGNARRILDSALITVRFEVEGASRVVFPPEIGETERRDELWKATCFECFVALAAPAYCEWNFAPNGNWAAYRFDDYREAMSKPDVEIPYIERTSVGDRARFQIDLAMGKEVAETVSGVLNLSLTAVIIEKGDAKPFYWALAHSGEKPDFHLRESFTLELGS